MVFANYDGTLCKGNSAMELATIAGREREAVELFSNLYAKSKKVIAEVRDQSQLMKSIDVLESLYHSTLQEGAKLIRGFPTSKIQEINYQPTPQYEKIIDAARREGSLEIATLTDEDFVKEFIRRNKTPASSIVTSSKLSSNNGTFRGSISRYNGIKAKGENYRGGSVFATSIVDILPCVKAFPENDVYIVGDDVAYIKDNHLLESTLERIEIPFKKLL
jgi:hypothetical protein